MVGSLTFGRWTGYHAAGTAVVAVEMVILVTVVVVGQ